MSLGMNLIGAGSIIDWFEDTTNMWGDDVAWLVGSNVEYAIDQEFGTAYQSGTPHLRPAADKTNARMAEFAVRADSIEEYVRMAALYLESQTKKFSPVDTGRLRSSYAAVRMR